MPGEPPGRKRAQFAALALPHMDAVYTTCLYLTRNPDEAQDLLQETFLRAYRFWHQFIPGTNCRAWLLTIAHNAFRSRLRDRHRQQGAEELEALDRIADRASIEGMPANPEDLVLDRILDGEIEEALRSLPREYLEAVLLVDIQELSYDEAARVLDCPVGTIRSRLSRGRHMLHRALREYARQRGYGPERRGN
jgi:RNA polymerase sigma-70 factor (ECF subfamily)